MCFDMMCCLDENEAWMGAFTARWKMLAVDACDFMLLAVCGIVDYSINTGMRNRISRLENIANACHHNPPDPQFFYSGLGVSILIRGCSEDLRLCQE
jgi:hypothetical protein